MANFLNLQAFLNLNASGFQIGMKRAESTAKQFSDHVKGEFAKAFGYGAIVAYSAKIINLADNLIDLSDRLGVSTKALQEWGYAAKKSGSDLDAVVRFFENIAVAREKALGGDKGTMDAFGLLGVSASDLKSMRLQDIGAKIGNSVKSGDVQSLISPLREIGGRGVTELIPAFKAGLEEAASAANKAGQVMDGELLLKLKQMKSEAQLLADVFTGPFATALAFASKIASGLFHAVSSTVASIAAFLGSLSGGASVKESIAAAREVMASAEAEFRARRKAMEEELKLRKAIDQAGSESTYSAEDLKNLASAPSKIVAAKSQTVRDREQMPLTAWQRIGSAVRFNPDSNMLRSIAENTRETARNTAKREEASVGTGQNPFGSFGP